MAATPILNLLRSLRARLTPVSGGFAQSDAEAIIGWALGISKTQIYTDTAAGGINEICLERVEEAVCRRLRGEPLQYIFGAAFFYDREFWVDKNVLIPRPDTETLVEAVIGAEKSGAARFADIGTGSGILAAVLVALRPGWSAVAVDVSFPALQTASRNRGGGGISLICCDMFSAIKPEKQFDFIVSNPPYISAARMAGLDKSVAGYEPHTALYGGEDGLDYYRVISERGKMYLKDTGRAYLEIGYDQGEAVPEIFNGNGWGRADVIKDLGGRDRVVKITAEAE